MQRYVRVVPYNPEWPKEYKREAARVAAALSLQTISTYHFGSTSIPGIFAKPVIDILVEVHDIQAIDDYNEVMVALGYEPKGEYGLPGRRFFIKGGDLNRTHNIHTFQTGDPEIERCINFRDYMIAHPGDAEAYSFLKQELAKKYPEDIQSYVKEKDPFIKEVIRKAKIWRQASLASASKT